MNKCQIEIILPKNANRQRWLTVEFLYCNFFIFQLFFNVYILDDVAYTVEHSKFARKDHDIIEES